jgi:hypothetical protein
MRELNLSETRCVSGAAKSTTASLNAALAEDMRELIATSSKRNLSVNKAIRVLNGLLGTHIKYL